MQLRGCWTEDSISSVYEEKREDAAIESDRWRGGGVESETEGEGDREMERREGVLWGT